jgi:hypothetical protein
VEFIKKGDIVSVPLMFVAAVKIVKRFDRYLFKCKWRSCRRSLRICGYGWLIGGQAEYDGAFDFQPIEIPDKEQAMERY